MKIFILTLLLPWIAMAQNEGVTKALKTEITKQKFIATLQSGYHFNDKAPNFLRVDEQKVSPTELNRTRVSFDLPATYKSAEAALFICDDANSFCEPRHIQLKGELKTESGDSNSKSTRKLNEHGFYETTLEDVKSMAESQHKLILADFSARWCPGCVRLEQEVFSSPEFSSATKNFIKVKFDVDRFENVSAKKNYGVYGIPTLIVLNGDLKEVSRIVDYQPVSSVTKFLKSAEENHLTFDDLKVKAKAGDKAAALTLGQRLYNAGQFADAVSYLSQITPAPIEVLDAKVQAAQKLAEKDDGKKEEAQQTIRNVLAQENSSSRSINWRASLANLLPKGSDERKKLAHEGIALANSIISEPKKLKEAIKGDLVGEFAGLEKLMVAFERADLAEAGELTESEVQAANQKVVQVGKSLHIPISKTGPSMRYLIALVGAKEWPQAEAQAEKLLARDPNNPELQRRLLKILNEEKKFGEAVKVGSEALPRSYGKNEIWVVQQLAKAYAGSNQKLEAKALIKSYLSRSDIDWSTLPKEKEDLSSQLEKLQAS